MAKKEPGTFDSFRGLWVRGHADEVPPDHFVDSLNNIFTSAGVETRPGVSQYLEQPNIIRMALYKPNSPFSGTQVPRIIYLKSDGSLFDSNDPTTPLYVNSLMKDFGFVNFFGRCYISPSDGKVGLSGVSVYVYNGNGPSGFRPAAGIAPAIGLTAVLSGSAGFLGVGTYLISYAFESASGFITRPATPFVAVDTFGTASIDVTNLPLGPSGTAARWIILSKAIPFRANLGIPFDVGTYDQYPLYLAIRVPNNTATTQNVSVYDENLIESADYLLTTLAAIPAGVGLLDYKGRMISYGEYANPSIVRGSTIGDPEAMSETSGFLILDPSDSTGVRSATEFRNLLYIFKAQRGYVTQDNQQEISTWEVINFEKSKGTEQYGVANILDAKGASAEGFVMASSGSLNYFNGTFQEPELSYKIKDLWLRINPLYFYKIQVANDPINRRLYILVPLDESTTVNYLIYCDYRDGLSPLSVKWDIWQFAVAPTSILIYNDFSAGDPLLVTRISNLNKIVTLRMDNNTVGEIYNVGDNGVAVSSYFELPPTRFFNGVNHFGKIFLRVTGPCSLSFVPRGIDLSPVGTVADLVVPSNVPAREYFRPMNLVSEYCRLKISKVVASVPATNIYKVNWVKIEGEPLWNERPQ